MIEIKEVCEANIDDIHGLAILECTEYNIKLFIPRECIEKYVASAKDENVFARVLVVQDVVIGFILIRKDLYIPSALIEQLFIHPKFRGSTAFLRLLRMGERWALEKECQLLFIGGIARLKKQDAFRLGYTEEHIYYAKEL